MGQNLSNWYSRAANALSGHVVYDWPNVPIERGSGCRVYGPRGEEYLDFCAGMATAGTGHCHPKVVAAIKKQAERLIHGPIGVLLYESIIELAEKLAEVTPPGLDQFLFLNSGSEAVEGSVKLARYVTGRPAVVAFVGAFHGRTLGATSLTTSKSKYRKHYEPLVGGTYFVPHPYCFRCPCGLAPATCGLKCFDFVQDLFDHCVDPSEVAAFIVEPVLGEGGYVPVPPGYMRRLRETCTNHGIMLIFDEIQTGFGRTGTMFAAQGFGVTPDIMVIAKAIASGMPLSAVVAPRDLMAKWTPGAHGTTFGGNPISCAAALATLDVFREERLLDNVQRQGRRAMEYLRQLLDSRDRYPILGDVRGLGLMIGIELVEPGSRTPNGKAVEAVLRGCLDRGLILYPCGSYGQSIRFIPPLIVTDSELDKGLDIFEQALRAVSAG